IGHVDALDRGRAGMADMVPHEIEPAKGARRAAHDVARELVLPQIADQREGAPAGGGDFGDDSLDPALVDIGDSDRRALFREAQRAGPSHPRCRRGDDPDLVGETHLVLPGYAVAFSAPTPTLPVCGEAAVGAAAPS